MSVVHTQYERWRKIAYYYCKFCGSTNLRTNYEPDKICDFVRQIRRRRSSAVCQGKDLNVSVITTRKAYEGLEAGGFTISMAGKGSFVAPENIELLHEIRLPEVGKKLVDIIEY